jgi:hypothetical protein
VPRDAACERFAALDAVSYRTLLDRMALRQMVLERLLLVRLVPE